MTSHTRSTQHRARRIPVALFIPILLIAIHPADAAEGSLTGKVATTGGKPVHEARVTLVELRLSTFSDEEGGFRFESLPPGHYHVQVVSRGRGSAVQEITIVEGDNVIELTLRISAHQENIIVTATRSGRGVADLAQPVNVLDEEAVNEKAVATLGGTLGQESGINQSYYGPGSSRPIVRGQGGSRVRVLQDGLGSGDASDTSPDHAVGVDPLSADSIEVLRGPATLLYGSSAVGGAVNVRDQRVPDHLSRDPLHGSFYLRGGSVADETTAGGEVTGRAGRIAYHLDGFVTRTDDYAIPGTAEVEPDDAHDDEEPARGTLPNSDIENERASLGLSHVWEDKGYVGLSFTGFDTNYGVPVGAHGHAEDDHHEALTHPSVLRQEEPEEHEEFVRVDLEQRRWDLRAGLDAELGPFNGMKLSLGKADYEHTELEGDEVGTVFQNDSWEGRVEVANGAGGRLSGTSGLQLGNRDFRAIGEEAFVPPTDTDFLALFAYQALRAGAMSYEFGLRFEREEVQAQDNPDREFDGVSGSFGWLWRFTEPWAVALSVSRTERPPNAEELYSGGPHLALGIFQVGDPDLEMEQALGGDLSLRKRSGRVTGEFNLFHNRFDDYIYPEQQFDDDGDPILSDGLPVYRFSQADAKFWGYELKLLFGLLHKNAHDLDLVLRSDDVRAELTDGGERLPRIPAQRYSLGLDYSGPSWTGSIEVQRIDDARPAEGETPTAGSTALNASVGRRFVGKDVVHSIILRLTNLTDEEIRLHTSFVKDFAPLPGRDIALLYKLTF